MKTKKKTKAKRSIKSYDWKLIFKLGGDVESQPDEPKLTVGQDVNLKFVNNSGGPLIMGFVTIGRRHKDSSVPANDDLVDSKKKYFWVPKGEIDSGINLIPDGGASAAISFTVQKVATDPVTGIPFHYCCFAVGPEIHTGKKRKPVSGLWRVEGWGFDPHVIITS